MILALTSDIKAAFPKTEKIFCLSIITYEKLKDLGYEHVELVSLPDHLLDGLRKYEAAIQPMLDVLLLQLGEQLNAYHKICFSASAWKYVIGLWCYQFLCVCADRYYRLTHLKACYPDVVVWGADQDKIQTLVPSTHQHFSELIKTENYNAILCTKIAQIIGFEMGGGACVEVDLKDFQNMLKRSIVSRIKTKTIDFFYHIFLKRAQVLMDLPYFPKNILIKFFLASFGRILVLNRWRPTVFTDAFDLAQRSKVLTIKSSISPETGLDRSIKSLLPLAFPILNLEGFSQHIKSVRPFFKTTVRAFFTAGGWFYNDRFKLLAAYYHDAGKLILGVPHGGGQFLRRYNHITHHEVPLSDIYYSWGKFPLKSYSHMIAITSPKYFYIENAKKNLSGVGKNYFLYVLTSHPAFTVDFDYFPEDFFFYLTFVQRFIGALNVDLQERMRVRCHWEQMGFKIDQRVKAISNKIKFDSWGQSFYQSLYEAELYICDHISTTYAEALLMNKPMILFFDLKKTEIVEDAIPLFKQLEHVGIYHQTPESAVRHIDKIKEDVNGWWFSVDVQRARRAFSEAFALTSDAPYLEWKKVFKDIYG